MFSTEKVLEIAREEEAARPAKRARGRPRKPLIVEAELKEEDKVSVHSFTTSEDELA